MFCLSTVSTNDYVKITGISFSKKKKKKPSKKGKHERKQNKMEEQRFEEEKQMWSDLVGKIKWRNNVIPVQHRLAQSHFCPSQPAEHVWSSLWRSIRGGLLRPFVLQFKSGNSANLFHVYYSS